VVVGRLRADPRRDGTAFLVYAIGARVLSRGAGVFAAVVSTLNPYLVWHDVHLNREILDQLLAAALVLCVLVAADRRSLPGRRGRASARASRSSATSGSALPLVLAAYLLVRTAGAGRRSRCRRGAVRSRRGSCATASRSAASR
jgi:hypothetical protein